MKEKEVKGRIGKMALTYLATAKTLEELKKRLLEVAQTLKRTTRKCKYCGKSFTRVEDGLLDHQIGDKEICSICAKKRGLLKETKIYGKAG